MKIIALLHVAAAILALTTSALVLGRPKGTRLHRRVGYLFFAAMVAVNATAALLYNLTGQVNLLHGFIVLSLLSLLKGMLAVWRRQPGWFQQHRQGMIAAAIGVWAAGAAELTIRVLPQVFGPRQIIAIAVGIGVLAFFLIGWLNYRYARIYPPAAVND